jgi:hypothetical protein
MDFREYLIPTSALEVSVLLHCFVLNLPSNFRLSLIYFTFKNDVFGMWCRLDLVKTNVLEERVVSVLYLKFCERRKALANGSRVSQLTSSYHQLTLFCARWFFCPEDGGDRFLRNVNFYKTRTTPHPRRRHSS